MTFTQVGSRISRAALDCQLVASQRNSPEPFPVMHIPARPKVRHGASGHPWSFR